MATWSRNPMRVSSEQTTRVLLPEDTGTPTQPPSRGPLLSLYLLVLRNTDPRLEWDVERQPSPKDVQALIPGTHLERDGSLSRQPCCPGTPGPTYSMPAAHPPTLTCDTKKSPDAASRPLGHKVTPSAEPPSHHRPITLFIICKIIGETFAPVCTQGRLTPFAVVGGQLGSCGGIRKLQPI